jgi:ubiquinone/menaquinone biosynthesis C-methylase UbiE/uncharacterized protein YbaR (Trm112 family)
VLDLRSGDAGNASTTLPDDRPRYADIIAARDAFDSGKNVTEFLRDRRGTTTNPVEAIEIAYDLQTGTYVDCALADPAEWHRYTTEIAAHLAPVLRPGDTLLDAGTGEATTLVGLLNGTRGLDRAYAFDLSWSRIAAGRDFAASRLREPTPIDFFVADMTHVPLVANSVDVVVTVHALESNGGRERELLQSLMRVARRRVVLFEPNFERAGSAARARMASHGYVRGLEAAIIDAGGVLESVEPFEHLRNRLNPTFVHVIAVPEPRARVPGFWACPASGEPMERRGDVYWSPRSGLAYPILDGIPVLRADSAILASAFGNPRPE